MSRIDIIIVNWNSRHLLRECLSSICARTRQLLGRVIVIDNASQDDSLEGLESLDLPLHLIRSERNLGFGAACNRAFASSTAPYVLFLNPDTRVTYDALERPLRFMESVDQRDVGVCSIQLVDQEGRVARTCNRRPTAWSMTNAALGLAHVAPKRFARDLMSDWDHGQTRDVHHVIGAFYFIRRETFVQTGGFDEDFFVYLEDLDLSLRVHQAGWRIVYLAEAQAFHYGGGTSEQIRARRLFYSLRSRMLYAAKHFGRGGALQMVAATLLLEPLPRLCLAAARCSPADAVNTLQAYGLLWRDAPVLLPRLVRLACRRHKQAVVPEGHGVPAPAAPRATVLSR